MTDDEAQTAVDSLYFVLLQSEVAATAFEPETTLEHYLMANMLLVVAQVDSLSRIIDRQAQAIQAIELSVSEKAEATQAYVDSLEKELEKKEQEWCF